MLLQHMRMPYKRTVRNKTDGQQPIMNLNVYVELTPLTKMKINL